MSIQLKVFAFYVSLSIFDGYLNIDAQVFFRFEIAFGERHPTVVWFRTGLEKHTKTNRFGTLSARTS